MTPKIVADKKRKRPVSSTSSARTYNADRFKSYQHQQRYQNDIRERNFVFERAFQLERDEYPEIQDVIRSRGWKTVVTFPKTAWQDIVKEFYANAYTLDLEKDDKYVSYVRGKQVRFDYQVINRLLGIRSPPYCAYEALTQAEPDAQALLTTLCRPRAQWQYTSSGKLKKLRSADLNPIPKTWCTFVHHTLLPRANGLDLITVRAQLVFSIVTGLTVDVGCLLANDISTIANDQTASLGHPFLICLICERAGVRPRKEEIPMIPTRAITTVWISKLPDGEVGASAPLSHKGLEIALQRLTQRMEADATIPEDIPADPMTIQAIPDLVNFTETDEEPGGPFGHQDAPDAAATDHMDTQEEPASGDSD